jgi:hypothetical protein
MALRLAPTRTKNKRGHRVPLGPLTARELQALATTARDKSGGGAPMTGLVFPGVASRVAWRVWAALGSMSRRQLNHITARGGLIGIYQRCDFQQEAEKALLAWQAHVASLVASVPELQRPIMRARRPSASVTRLPSSRSNPAVA